MYLNSSIARQIAESVWGRGGTSALKTNRRGAYYFSCSGHGGFVISSNALSATERADIEKYVEAVTMDVYLDAVDDSVLTVMHPYRTRSGRTRTRNGWRVVKEQVFLLEEDCGWSLAVKFAGIVAGENMSIKAAERVFYDWYDMNNPVVVERARVFELRKARDPDLIIAAQAVSNGVVKVWTADEKTHMVSNYNEARDSFGNAYLSRCNVVASVLS
jgi:hypothetical protein